MRVVDDPDTTQQRECGMPYYWVPLVYCPFPHAMRKNDTCPFALNSIRSHLRDFTVTPGPSTYQQLYADPDFVARARGCTTHLGDWATVLPAIADLLATTTALTSSQEIEALARTWPSIASLNDDDRHLAAALLDSIEPIRIYRMPKGDWRASGQHRICWARIAAASHVPAWCAPGQRWF